MRNAFIRGITDLASQNPKLFVITADLGFGVFEPFIERFPKQYLNVGVAEQNMMGVATGLALEGYTVYTYSIGNFPTLRCLEQVRNDACYHDANINIVVSGGGFSYGPLGMSHHATEDLAILRALPNMVVTAPATPWEAFEATKALATQPGVGYLRLEKNTPNQENETQEIFTLGQARQLREGNDITFIATGGITMEALLAAETLCTEHGLSARVISMHTIKPIDKVAIQRAAIETGGIITIEEHTVEGGLGSIVAEICLENQFPVKKFYRVGLRDTFSSIVGSQQYLREYYHMDANAIIRHTLTLLAGSRC